MEYRTINAFNFAKNMDEFFMKLADYIRNLDINISFLEVYDFGAAMDQFLSSGNTIIDMRKGMQGLVEEFGNFVIYDVRSLEGTTHVKTILRVMTDARAFMNIGYKTVTSQFDRGNWLQLRDQCVDVGGETNIPISKWVPVHFTRQPFVDVLASIKKASESKDTLYYVIHGDMGLYDKMLVLRKASNQPNIRCVVFSDK